MSEVTFDLPRLIKGGWLTRPRQKLKAKHRTPAVSRIIEMTVIHLQAIQSFHLLVLLY